MADNATSGETEENHIQVDVVVIGAGACGLLCGADLLDNSELTFRILEGRDRVGGRIYTTNEKRTKVNSSGAEELEFCRDHGASWIHGLGGDMEQNPIVDLLCERTTNFEDQISRVFDGNPWTRPESVLHRKDAIALYMDRKIVANDSLVVTEGIKRHYSLRRKLSHFGNDLYARGDGMNTVRVSVHESCEIVSSQEVTPANIDSESNRIVEKLYPFYGFLCENWNGLSSTELQLSTLIEDATGRSMHTDECYASEGDYPGAHCKVKQGMSSVIERLATKLEDTTLLGQTATDIYCMGDSVFVKTSSGLTVEAQCCVSTIPLGCLKKCADSMFHPRLSEGKREAIRSIAAGAYKKVFLTFNSIFWPVDKPLIGLIRDHCGTYGIGKYLLVNNLWAKDGIPCLEAVLCGDMAKWAFHKPDNSIKDYVLEFLQHTMPVTNVAEYCIDCHVTRWEEDNFTSGSYSSFTLGTLDRHVDALCSSEWDGRLIFAGEATESEHMGSVHAALLSGKRAATRTQSFVARVREAEMPQKFVVCN